MDPSPRLLYLIDGHGQIFRAYFAIRGGMNSPHTGEPTHATFAFAGMLLKLFGGLRPQYVAMAIDLPGKTFRDELYPAYKATRPPLPEDFRPQEQRCLELTRMFGIPVLGVPGAEADDVIATMVDRIRHDPAGRDVHVRIVSKDKDLEQLLSDRVAMFDIHTDTTLDLAKLKQDKGITPEQVVDVLALMGDAVDNVPGVDGIGPKTAAALIQEFGSIDNLLANLDKVKGKRRENLEKGRALLPLSRQLVRLKRDVEVPFTLDDARVRAIDGPAIRHLFEELGFRRHIADLDRLLAALAKQGVAMGGGSTPRQADGSAAPPRTEAGERFPTGLFDGVVGPSAPETGAPMIAGAAAIPVGVETVADCDYRAATTSQELADLVQTLTSQPVFAIDTETIGLGHRARLCGLSVAWRDHAGVYIPVRSPDPGRHLGPEQVLAALRPVLEDPSRPKCGHNLKYDWLVLRHEGVELRGIVFDSMIASHLLGSSSHGLKDLALTVLEHQSTPISQLIGVDAADADEAVDTGAVRARKATEKTMDQVPLDLITRYAGEDADMALRLYHHFEGQLRLLGMEALSRDVEMPLVEVLADMEFNGIRVDPAILEEQKRPLATRIVDLRDRIHEAAGAPFNIDSPKQLAEVLFKRLGLPVIKKTKTGPSTDVEVLEKLAELDNLTREQAAVPTLIVEYRQLTKLVGTYLDALCDCIDPQTRRVHATFHQTGAATGRLSSSGPNLQNIPIRTEVGRQIRKAFVAEPGSQLISADYSQIELRILAHLSEDKALTQAFADGLDIHSAVASEVFKTPLNQVTKEQRNSAKVVNFGIVYGVTAYGLARRIEGLSVEAAGKLIADYRARFAGIDAFLDKCIRQARDLGYVTTMLGRRRAIPQANSTNPNARALGERLAINSVVQGSAADLIKLAMVNLYRRLRREGLPMRLLLQIHDELVLEAPTDAAPAVAKVVQEEMEGAMALKVPLKAEAAVGVDWFSAM